MSPSPDLVGSLSAFALADVLQLLELGGRAGLLAIDAGPRGRGGVSVRNGRILDVTYAGSGGPAGDAVDRLGALMALPAGQWAFHPELGPPTTDGGAASGLRIADALLQATCREDERSASRRPVAASGPVPASDASRLTGADLAVLATADGTRTVSAIAAATRQDPVAVRSTIERLRSLGLLATTVPAER